MFYEANKQIEIINEFIWKFTCVFDRYIFRTVLSNKIISTPININRHISYEGILKHRKYRCDSFSVVLYLSWIMTRELHVGCFHSKSFYVLRDISIYHLLFLWFVFNVIFLTTSFSLSTRFINTTDILTVTWVTSTVREWLLLNTTWAYTIQDCGNKIRNCNLIMKYHIQSCVA